MKLVNEGDAEKTVEYTKANGEEAIARGGEAVKQTGLSAKLTNNQRSFWVIGTRNDCS